MLTSLTTTLTTEESSKYWPRLPIAIPFPPWQVICGLVSRAPITTRPLYILGINIIRARFYGNTIVPALVVHIRQHDVVCIHGIKPIGILDPVRAKWCIDGCGIVDDIIEPHMSPVHNIERPQRRIFDEDYIIRYELIFNAQRYSQCSTNTSLTFQKTNGIGRPGCVFPSSASDHYIQSVICVVGSELINSG